MISLQTSFNLSIMKCRFCRDLTFKLIRRCFNLCTINPNPIKIPRQNKNSGGGFFMFGLNKRPELLVFCEFVAGNAEK